MEFQISRIYLISLTCFGFTGFQKEQQPSNLTKKTYFDRLIRFFQYTYKGLRIANNKSRFSSTYTYFTIHSPCQRPRVMKKIKNTHVKSKPATYLRWGGPQFIVVNTVIIKTEKLLLLYDTTTRPRDVARSGWLSCAVQPHTNT